MKIVIIGGHLAPALSVMEALDKHTQILFIGRKYALEGENTLSLEYKTISGLEIPFVGLNTGRLQRKLTRYTFFSLLKLLPGIIKAFLTLSKFKPDIVVGFGGYVSIPVIFSAFLLGIPVVIHEQTMGAGLANKLVAPFAKKICISWDSSRRYFPKSKTVMTGNPIRKFSILKLPTGKKLAIFNNKLPVIYVTGGSSGSHSINVLMEEIVKELLVSYNIIHQVGDTREYGDFERLDALKDSLSDEQRENYIVQKFIDPNEIGDIFNLSSLIVSRAGMNTITELIYFQKPAILIPLPFSQGGEQYKNAKLLEKIGLGIILQQQELTGKKLLQAIKKMTRSIKKYKINEKEKENYPVRSAARNIISVIRNVYESKATKKS